MLHKAQQQHCIVHTNRQVYICNLQSRNHMYILRLINGAPLTLLAVLGGGVVLNYEFRNDVHGSGRAVSFI